MTQHREIENKTYNERLFSPGIRGFFHNARFDWLQRSFKRMGITKGTVLEIGCNDARSIRYIPFEPLVYTGYDADWEGGFDEAAGNYRNYPKYHFIKSTHPSTFNKDKEVYDYVLAMETLEHLPGKFLTEYLEKLAAATGKYGFFSVPNEKGIVFFLKYFAKRLFKTAGQEYSAKEIAYALAGKLSKIERKDTTHKGFDYDVLTQQLSEYYEILEKKGIPFGWLPASLNFTIGIIVKRK